MRCKLSAALLSAACTHAYANETLPDIVVTATRTAQSADATLASVTVITRQDIEDSQAVDVRTLLRSVAGVEISSPGGYGKGSLGGDLYLRGNNGNHVLVLLDGVRISSATSGTTEIEQLMLDQVERIEVVRGNVSSLYGSEAIGGVVQIFTKHGRGAPAVNVGAGMGSQGTQRLSVGFSGAVKSTNFNVQASRFKTDGVSALNPVLFSGANPDKDGYDNTSLSANVRHAFNQDHSLTATAFNSEGHNQYDNSFGLPTDGNSSKSQVNKYSLSSDNCLSDNWQSHLQLAQGVDDTQTFLNGQLDLANGAIFKTSNQQITWQNTLQLDKHNVLMLGVENLIQQVTSDVAYTIKKRKVNSLFAGYTGYYGSHQVQANLRQDGNSQYGSTNTWLFGYGYALSEAWRVTASRSTAFNTPTFNQLYYPNTGWGGGNPALQPEHTRSLEAGVHYDAADNQKLDVVYFDNRIHNLISGWPPVNINQARTDGVEVSYAGQFGDTGVKAALTSQNPRDVTTGRVLDRRAKLHSSLAATQQLGVWQLGGEWLYSDTRQDAGKTLGSYNVLNLTAGYTINKDIKLSLRAENLTNQNDSTVYGYNPLGRRLSVGLHYQP